MVDHVMTCSVKEAAIGHTAWSIRKQIVQKQYTSEYSVAKHLCDYGVQY
jgi:hypothetical protein